MFAPPSSNWVAVFHFINCLRLLFRQENLYLCIKTRIMFKKRRHHRKKIKDCFLRAFGKKDKRIRMSQGQRIAIMVHLYSKKRLTIFAENI